MSEETKGKNLKYSTPKLKLKPGVGPVGGKRRGAGRPQGSKNIYSYDSVKRLKELDFDPIEEMVTQYRELDGLVLDSFNKKPGPSIGAPTQVTAQLKATQQKIINDLMPYGYRKLPEKTESEVTNHQPLTINFNTGEIDGQDESKAVGDSKE